MVTNNKKQAGNSPQKSVSLSDLRDRPRKPPLDHETWFALARRCYELAIAGAVQEARKLLPEIERLRNLIESAAKRSPE